MRAPYLIQRGELRQPLAEGTARFSDAVNCDYMGSAEFEFGALPQSLRRFQAQKANWSIRKIPEITEDKSAEGVGERQLRVLSCMNDAQFAEYKAHLIAARHEKTAPRTKESTNFTVEARARSKYSAETDFWWDIDNDVMFSFHKIAMNRLQQWLESSFAYMDNQKKNG